MDWPSLEPPRFIWSGFSQKIANFGALDAWIGAWNWQKWPQAILSQQLGCDMAHQALSRWTGLAWSLPGLFGPDLAKNSHFWGPGCLGRCLELEKKVASSVVLCVRKVLVRSAQVLCINGITAAENVTKKVKK